MSNLGVNMERNYFCVDYVQRIALLASLCLVLFLCGFYFGFSETFELNRIQLSQDGIRFGGGNPYRERVLKYGFVAVLLLVSLLMHTSKLRAAKIVGASVLLFSLFQVWGLFTSTPSVLSGNGTIASSPINLIFYLDLFVLPIFILLLFLYLRDVWHFSTQFRERTIVE